MGGRYNLPNGMIPYVCVVCVCIDLLYSTCMYLSREKITCTLYTFYVFWDIFIRQYIQSPSPPRFAAPPPLVSTAQVATTCRAIEWTKTSESIPRKGRGKPRLKICFCVSPLKFWTKESTQWKWWKKSWKLSILSWKLALPTVENPLFGTRSRFYRVISACCWA